MIRNRTKSFFGKGLLKFAQLDRKLERKADYAAEKPGLAVVKTVDALVVDPFTTIGKGAVTIGKGVAEPVPYLLKQSVKGLKSVGTGAAKAFRHMDPRQVDTDGNSPRAQKASGYLTRDTDKHTIASGTLNTLRQGAMAAAQLHAALDKMPLSIKADWSNVFIHETSSIGVKAAKMTGMTAAFHIPLLHHLPVAHVLSDQALLTKMFGGKFLTGAASQAGTAVGMYKATEPHFSDSLAKSNLWEKDREISGRGRELSRVKDGLRSMARALEGLSAIQDNANGREVNDKTRTRAKVLNTDLTHIDEALDLAQKMTALVQSRSFAELTEGIDMSRTEEHADYFMQQAELGNVDRSAFTPVKRFDLEAAREQEAAEAAARAATPAATPVSETASDVSTSSSRFSRFMSRRSESMRNFKLGFQQKREQRAADKNQQRAAEITDAMKYENFDNQYRAALGEKPKYFTAGHAQLAEFTTREELHRAISQAKFFEQSGLGENDPQRAAVIAEVASLANKLVLQMEVSDAIPLAKSRLWRGEVGTYEAQVALFDKDFQDANEKVRKIEKELAGLASPLKVVEKDIIQQRRILRDRLEKVKLKRRIAELERNFVQLRLDLSDLIRKGDPKSVTEGALANRYEAQQVALQLEEAKAGYAAAADKQHRTSPYVQPNQKPIEEAPALVNAAVKGLWWTAGGGFILTAIPYWSIRNGVAIARERAYLNYIASALGEDAVDKKVDKKEEASSTAVTT